MEAAVCTRRVQGCTATCTPLHLLPAKEDDKIRSRLCTSQVTPLHAADNSQAQHATRAATAKVNVNTHNSSSQTRNNHVQ
mmetsp:Transcript_33021/g.83027  ORF Transcript_33021/g.83027 Transcript_33021/m.83027 type:complete len:80 (-) Transcript_33021:51-290(-)